MTPTSEIWERNRLWDQCQDWARSSSGGTYGGGYPHVDYSPVHSPAMVSRFPVRRRTETGYGSAKLLIGRYAGQESLARDTSLISNLCGGASGLLTSSSVVSLVVFCGVCARRGGVWDG